MHYPITPQRTEIVFVFDDLADWQQLASAGREAGHEVVVLDGSQDGLVQMANFLQGRSGVDAIHILSHGDVGQVQLGSVQLDSAGVAARSQWLAGIGQSLSADGDLLLYGCRSGADDAGRDFVQALARATGADVAASNDVTGSTQRGGDWVLEVQAGRIQAGHAVSDAGRAAYQGTLAPVNNAPTFAPAAPGTGKLVTDFGSGTSDFGLSVTVQADGKIVVAGGSTSGGSYNFAVVRYNTDGSLDTGFGSGGKLVTDFGSGASDEGRSVTVQADGKIVVAGYSTSGGSYDFAVARYNTDGSLDTSFGSGGKLVTDFGSATYDEGQSVTVQPDGKIVVAGYSTSGGSYDFAVVRYNTDGSLDTSFNSTGKLVTDFGSGASDLGYSVTVQADGKIVVAGRSNSGGGSTNFAVVRYNTDGSLDTSFNSTGKLVTDIGSGANDVGYSVTVQADGKIVVAGYSNSGGSTNFAVVRYNTDGSLDTGFNGTGKLVTDIGSATYDEGRSVTVQADGKIVVAGYSDSGGSNNFAVVRYNTDGSLDTTFNSTGKLFTDIGSGASDEGRSVTVQADGKIVVAGYSISGGTYNFAVVRYNTDGSLDTSFNPGPAVNTLGAAVAYTENASAIALDASVAVFDADLAALNGGAGNYSGASVTLARSGGSAAEDVFSARGNLAFTAGNAVLSGTTVGTVSNTGGTLTISFNANATQARVNEVLSSIGYANTSDAPPASVQVDWSFSDGNTGSQGSGGALTAAGSTTVNITAVNDAPTITGLPGSAQAVTAGAAAALADFAVADADGAAASLTVTLTATNGTINGLTDADTNQAGIQLSGTAAAINAAIASATFTAGAAGAASIGVSVSDGIAPAVTGTYHLSAAAAVNNAPTFAPAAPGTGKLVTDFGSGTNDVGYSVTAQADGKIVVAGASNSGGSYNFAVVRYNTDGSLDTGFNGTGKLVTDIGSATYDVGHSVTVQADGKIVVAGYNNSGGSNNFAVVRYNTDGSLDTGFGSSGKLVTDFGSGTNDVGLSVTVQTGGKIVVAGYSDSGGSTNFAVARYNTDGSLDTGFGSGFGSGGKLVTDFGSATYDEGRSVTVQADGKIVVAGFSYSGSSYDFAVVRYNTDGSLDTSFNPGPAVNTLGAAVAYTENASAIALDASVAVFDADLAALNGGAGDYSGASVTLARAGGSAAEDVFSARGNLAFTAGSAVLSGTTVGTVSNTGGTLTISFNANATQARVNEVLSSIGYANTSDAPPASVQIGWSFSDGNTSAQGSGGALTAVGSTMVNITAVNDAPVNTVPAAQGVNQNASLTFNAANGNLVSVSDVDAGAGVLQVSLTASQGTLTLSGTAGLGFTTGDGTADAALVFSGTLAAINAALNDLAYAPTPGYTGAATLQIVTSDTGLSGTGGSLSDTDTIGITVAATAPPPPPPPPEPEPEPEPVDDEDNIPAALEDAVPGLAPAGGGVAVAGDGNGDGIKDSLQAQVGSLAFVLSPTAVSNPGSAPPTFTTLVASSIDGKVTADASNSRITNLSQKDATANLPEGMEMSIGLVSFTVALGAGKTGENFSLYVDPALGVNGYWKQDASGTWANLASQPYGGKMVLEGGRVRLDFRIEDGGQFDADGKADGIITDPGAPAYLPLSIVGQAPELSDGGFWF